MLYIHGVFLFIGAEDQVHHIASEVATLWHHAKLYIIIIICILNTPGSIDPRG